MHDRPRTCRATLTPKPARRRTGIGFTLLEVLVSIGVIGVLLALILPALSQARGSARVLQSQANLRALYVGVMMYVEGEQAFPCIVDDMLYPDIDGTTFSHTYWEVENVWHGIIYPYFPHDENLEAFFSPGLSEWSPQVVPSYAYSHSFVGQPTIWSGRPLADAAGLEGPARPGAVRFASSKVLLWDRALGFEDDRIEHDDDENIAQATPTCFADGSVHMLVPASASAAVPNPLNARSTGGMKLHNTRHGVLGRDY